MGARAFGSSWLVATAVVAGIAATATAADVTSRTTYRYYPMGGSTPVTIVDYFHAHPFPGDRGPALANLHASYSLAITTRERGGLCRVAAINLNVDFVITLPKATEEPRMSSATRSKWRTAVAFARAHEDGHRRMDLACARTFIARARQVSERSCSAVESEARRMLQNAEAACEARQVGYDLKEARRAGNLALFRAARLARR